MGKHAFAAKALKNQTTPADRYERAAFRARDTHPDRDQSSPRPWRRRHAFSPQIAEQRRGTSRPGADSCRTLGHRRRAIGDLLVLSALDCASRPPPKKSAESGGFRRFLTSRIAPQPISPQPGAAGFRPHYGRPRSSSDSYTGWPWHSTGTPRRHRWPSSE